MIIALIFKRKEIINEEDEHTWEKLIEESKINAPILDKGLEYIKRFETRGANDRHNKVISFTGFRPVFYFQ